VTQARILHLLARWQHWLAEAERLEELYDRRKAEHIGQMVRRRGRPMDRRTAAADWESTVEARGLISAGEWAHRKAQTYGIAILVVRSAPAPTLATPRQARQID
jgi:hypothetical protein